jgi:hypothetical protein
MTAHCSCQGQIHVARCPRSLDPAPPLSSPAHVPARSRPRCTAPPGQQLVANRRPRGSAAWTAAEDPAGARDLFAKLLPVRERIFGPDHRTHSSPVTASPAGPGGLGTRPRPG